MSIIQGVDGQDKYDIIQLRQGSAEAFERLFRRYGPKLYHFILKLSAGNAYLAEEVVQRTFVKIWETHHAVDPRKSFVSYLCTIAKNMLLNEFEHQTVEYVYREYAVRFCPAETEIPDKEYDVKQLQQYLDRLIDRLPPARRKIYIMSRRDMLSSKEIARKLNITESTIYTQLSKAVEFIRANLEHDFKELLSILLLVCFAA